MERKDAIAELQNIQGLTLKQSEAVEVAVKSLSDKKSRYWKRRYLKLRDKIKYAINTYENLNLNGSAEFLRIFLLGENNEQRVDDGSIQCNVEE